MVHRAISLLEDDGGAVQGRLLAPLRRLTALQVRQASETNQKRVCVRAWHACAHARLSAHACVCVTVHGHGFVRAFCVVRTRVLG